MYYVRDDSNHIAIGRGRAGTFTFQISEALGTNPVCVMGVKRNPGDGAPVFTVKATPANGACTFAVASSKTLALEEGTYFYDVCLYRTGAGCVTVAAGLLDIDWVGSEPGDGYSGGELPGDYTILTLTQIDDLVDTEAEEILGGS